MSCGGCAPACDSGEWDAGWYDEGNVVELDFTLVGRDRQPADPLGPVLCEVRHHDDPEDAGEAVGVAKVEVGTYRIAVETEGRRPGTWHGRLHATDPGVAQPFRWKLRAAKVRLASGPAPGSAATFRRVARIGGRG